MPEVSVRYLGVSILYYESRLEVTVYRPKKKWTCFREIMYYFGKTNSKHEEFTVSTWCEELTWNEWHNNVRERKLNISFDLNYVNRVLTEDSFVVRHEWSAVSRTIPEIFLFHYNFCHCRYGSIFSEYYHNWFIRRKIRWQDKYATVANVIV